MQNNREIITLQLGDYANHVAAHFWNLEWENATLDTQNMDSKENDNDTFVNRGDIYTTNPYKSTRYKNLKQKRSSSRPSHDGTVSGKESNRNLNPHICFHSNKQISSHNIKNKLNINQTMYSPRTIIFAAHGSEGDITSNVYDSTRDYATQQNNTTNNNNSNAVFTWNNDINVIHQSPHTNSTTNTSDCTFWSDYLLPTLHDKSLFLLDGIHHFSTPFYSYATGYDLLNSATSTSNELCESMDDRIRWWVESCDWFQGFQLFASSFGSFSGFTPSLINTLHDDYSNKCVLLYDITPSKSSMQSYASLACTNNASSALQKMNEKRFKLNSIVSMSQIWSEVSNIIPISVDQFARHKQHTNRKFYNTAIVGSCLHHYTNAARLHHSNIRLMDIVNCTVTMKAIKMSMLSSSSSHLDLDLNYQAIDSIEKLLMFNTSAKKQAKKQPLFPRLACLGPMQEEYVEAKSTIFGEYSCLNGSNIYASSPQMIEEWKQKKMILAQKQGSSETDIELFCDQWKYEREEENYHLKLMTKLAAHANTPLRWHLVNKSWKLPSTHPFYYDKKSEKKEERKRNDDEQEEEEGDDDDVNRNSYSIWSSGWSSNVIGDNYLNKCAQNLSNVIKYGDGHKIFGDVEMDLHQYNDDLLSFARAYCVTEDLDNE